MSRKTTSNACLTIEINLHHKTHKLSLTILVTTQLSMILLKRVHKIMEDTIAVSEDVRLKKHLDFAVERAKNVRSN